MAAVEGVSSWLVSLELPRRPPELRRSLRRDWQMRDGPLASAEREKRQKIFEYRTFTCLYHVRWWVLVSRDISNYPYEKAFVNESMFSFCACTKKRKHVLVIHVCVVVYFNNNDWHIIPRQQGALTSPLVNHC